MSSKIAIQVTGLNKHYRLYGKPQDRLKQSLFRRKDYGTVFVALKDINLTIKKGETVGIVGRNGSGKSTLLQLICGTLAATSGTIDVHGRVSALLELGAGFNPDFTGRENIFLNAAILGLSHRETMARFDDIVAFSGLSENSISQPVRTYSSGMYVRLAFAVAAASDPDILIIDEALSVGDEAFQRKCFARLRSIQERGGTILFVSHAARNVIELCDRAILIEQGEKLLEGSPKNVLATYHKLIYAPKEQQEEVRSTIRNHDYDALEEFPEASYAEELRSESALAYVPHGAVITDPRITTPEGETVNLLAQGKEYIFRYNVECDTEARHVQFGMMIKTTSGVELGGASIDRLDDTKITAHKGSRFAISFRFQALLGTGTYFLNCGCKGEVDGKAVTLHRIIDALIFKILPKEHTIQTGPVDFMIVPSVTTL